MVIVGPTGDLYWIPDASYGGSANPRGPAPARAGGGRLGWTRLLRAPLHALPRVVPHDVRRPHGRLRHVRLRHRGRCAREPAHGSVRRRGDERNAPHGRSPDLRGAPAPAALDRRRRALSSRAGRPPSLALVDRPTI